MVFPDIITYIFQKYSDVINVRKHKKVVFEQVGVLRNSARFHEKKNTWNANIND